MAPSVKVYAPSVKVYASIGKEVTRLMFLVSNCLCFYLGKKATRPMILPTGAYVQGKMVTPDKCYS